jgi:two-component system, NarL family, invasion response regulator UvrY
MIRVILVDDHAMIRRGVRETLTEAGGIDVVGEAGDYPQLRELLRGTHCDVLLLDVNLPGRSGIEALQTLSLAYPQMRAIVMSQYAEDQYGVRALKAGAMAYLNKSADPSVIVEAVRAAALGQRFVTPQIAQALAETVAGRGDGAPHERLSEREMQTLIRIARGEKLSEIADALLLSPKTVSVYRARVLEKLSLGSNADIAAYAVRNKLLD